MIYVVDRSLTGAGAAADEFLDAAVQVFDEVAGAQLLRTERACAHTTPSAQDAVIIVNGARDVPDSVADLLEEAVANGALIFPVALSAPDRRPATGLTGRQSFDVDDALRIRGLPRSGLRTIGAAFARKVLAQMLPTMVAAQTRVFLSYRRADGEVTAARLDDALSTLHAGLVFRDLVDIDVGGDAYHRIQAALDVADVLVLLDTFQSGASPWIEMEVAEALGRKIPVVWVRIGPDVSEDGRRRRPLAVRPQREPHVVVTESALDAARARAVADDVLAHVFVASHEHARSALATWAKIKRSARAAGKHVEVLDARRLIYQVSEHAAAAPWPRRPRTDVLQVFGRHPRDDDRARLVTWLEDEHMGPHDRACRSYDAAVLLDPRPVVTAHADDDGTVIAGARTYLASMTAPDAAPLVDPDAPPRRLLLLGADPDLRDESHVVAAAASIVRTWLERGGHVVLGGHPTFVPMTIEVARHVVAGQAPRVRVYQSEHFPPNAYLRRATDVVDLVLTPDAGSFGPSLTLMRHRMVRDGAYAAVVALGGRTDEGGNHRPGLHEELGLAREIAAPIYLIGAPGGYTAVEAERAASDGYSWTHNGLGVPGNERLRTSEDYDALADDIWTDAGAPRRDRPPRGREP